MAVVAVLVLRAVPLVFEAVLSCAGLTEALLVGPRSTVQCVTRA